jgi:hypothetical protein
VGMLFVQLRIAGARQLVSDNLLGPRQLVSDNLSAPDNLSVTTCRTSRPPLVLKQQLRSVAGPPPPYMARLVTAVGSSLAPPRRPCAAPPASAPRKLQGVYRRTASAVQNCVLQVSRFVRNSPSFPQAGMSGMLSCGTVYKISHSVTEGRALGSRPGAGGRPEPNAQICSENWAVPARGRAGCFAFTARGPLSPGGLMLASSFEGFESKKCVSVRGLSQKTGGLRGPFYRNAGDCRKREPGFTVHTSHRGGRLVRPLDFWSWGDQGERW